jgi:hypothetical protein
LARNVLRQSLFHSSCQKEQKEFCAEVAQDVLETANKDPDLPKKVITGDESWVYDYGPETKVHSSQWKSSKSSRMNEEGTAKSATSRPC